MSTCTSVTSRAKHNQHELEVRNPYTHTRPTQSRRCLQGFKFVSGARKTKPLYGKLASLSRTPSTLWTLRPSESRWRLVAQTLREVELVQVGSWRAVSVRSLWWEQSRSTIFQWISKNRACAGRGRNTMRRQTKINQPYGANN